MLGLIANKMGCFFHVCSCNHTPTMPVEKVNYVIVSPFHVSAAFDVLQLLCLGESQGSKVHNEQ